MPDEDLLARIEDLERRLRLLESRNPTPAPSSPPTPAPAAVTDSLVSRVSDLRTRATSHTPPPAPSSTPPPLPIAARMDNIPERKRAHAVPSTPAPPPPQPEASNTVHPASPAPLPPPQPTVANAAPSASSASPALFSGNFDGVPDYEPAPPRSAGGSAGTWERVVGLKWTAWLGALILVVGGGLGIKFAYDQGWLGGLPPSARWAMLMLSSVALLGGGEWAMRKVGRLASVGFFAAGIAMMFVISYAGHAYFELYGGNTAFVLMGVSALVGAAVSIRGNLVSIALVALLGAHITPLVIGGEPHIAGFLIYLSALHILALFLAGRGAGPDGQKWWALRGFALTLSALWTLNIAVTTGSLPWEVALFTAVVATLSHFELAFTASRPRTAGTIAAARAAAARTYALLLSAFPAITIAFLYRGDDIRLLYFGTAAWLVLGSAAWCLRRLASTSPDPDRTTALLALDDVYRLKSLSLLALGITGGLSGYTETFAYAGLGVALALYATFVPAPSVFRRTYSSLFGLALPLVTVGRLTLDLARAFEPPRSVPREAFAGLNYLPQALYVLLAALVAQFTAYLSARPRPTDVPLVSAAAVLASGFCTLAALVATLALTDPNYLAVVLLVVLGAVWAVAGFTDRGWIALLRPLYHAWAFVAVAAAHWLIFVAVGPRLERGYASASELVLLNPTALTGVLSAGAVFGLAWCLRRWRPTPVADGAPPANLGMVVAFAIALIMVLGIGLLEIDRVVGTSARFLDVKVDIARVLLGCGWTALCLVGWAAGVRRLSSSAQGILNGTVVPVVLVCIATAFGALATLVTSPTPIANVAFVTSLLAAAVAVFYSRTLRESPALTCAAAGIAAGGLLLVSGGVELLRLDDAFDALGPNRVVSTATVLLLWAMAFALAFGAAAHRFALRWSGYDAFLAASALTLLAAAAACLAGAQLLVWTTGALRNALPLANIQCASALLTLLALFALDHLWSRHWSGRVPSLGFIRWNSGLIGVGIFFVASSAEVGRLLGGGGGGGGSDRLVAAGYSVWWGILALAAVVAGFRWHFAAARYAGLALFGIVLLKVVFLDLAGAGQGWRILSFLALGGLLLATSVLYGKLAPLLLSEPPPPPPLPLPPVPPPAINPHRE